MVEEQRIVNEEELRQLAGRGILLIYDHDYAISWLGPVKSDETWTKVRERLGSCRWAVLLLGGRPAEIRILRPAGNGAIRERSIEARGKIGRLLDFLVYEKPRVREPDKIHTIKEWLEVVGA